MPRPPSDAEYTEFVRARLPVRLAGLVYEA